jgi:DNA-binding NtrC family response regulator
MKRRVLIIDGDSRTSDPLYTELSRRGFDVLRRTTCVEALSCLDAGDVAAVVVDVAVRGVDGRSACWELVVRRDDASVIVVAELDAASTALAATRAGAYDFVVRPCDTDDLECALRRAIDHRQLKDEVSRLRRFATDGTALLSMDAIEQQHVTRVLEAVRGNKALAARVLGMDRRTLYRKLDRWRDQPAIMQAAPPPS